MAIYGNLDIIRTQIDCNKFKVAIDYLDSVINASSIENKRLKSYTIGSFKKIELKNNNFALEQVYNSKDRQDCFFESHKKYIDVQFILEGEESIEISNITNLVETYSYDEGMDLIKYEDIKDSSILKLRKGDVAIFYPEDAHMPCIKLNGTKKIIKTVIEVPFD